MTDSYGKLIELVREAHLLSSTSSLLGWDQETMLPAGGVAWRARQLAQLARLSHAMSTDPRLGELLLECESSKNLTADPHSDSAANLRELRRSYDRQVQLPGALVAEIAETQSLAQHAWAEARAVSDFAKFRPWLEKMVGLMRQKASCIGRSTAAGSATAAGDAADGDTAEAWDVLAEGFEPGVRAARLQEIFGPLRSRLREFVGDLLENGTPPSGEFNRQKLPIPRQEDFVRQIATEIGFDFKRGRMDRSTHPFCSGSHPGDVRITTRFHEDNLIDALGSTMHESGHAMYEQGLPAEHAGTPLGQAVSLGVHESQSRLWENHVGRSREFWEWCQPRVQAVFGKDTARYDATAMYGAANLVQPSLIRVEADEATYDLHVVVRFEIELALFRGEIEVADVPALWNEKYRENLGVTVPDDARGCLQDVHWSCGLFGYFPTYTLGNLFAAQVFATARETVGEFGAQFAAGEFAPLRNWLRQNVHAHGSRFLADELCERVTGAPLGMDPLMDYLESKLRPLYGL